MKVAIYGQTYQDNAIENLIELLISLEYAKGEVLASKTIQTDSGDWKKYTAFLNTEASCDSALLVVLARSNGSLAMDMISLFPGSRPFRATSWRFFPPPVVTSCAPLSGRY